jgi:long-chain-fatty-acid---luciferin-component ligase
MNVSKSVIDQFLAIDDPWKLSEAERKDLLVRSIAEAAEFHYANNPVWRKLCDSRNFSPGEIKTYDDLKRIPVISTRAFKGGFNLLSVPEKDIVKVHMSSGTLGSRSRVPRDKITMERNRISMLKTIDKFRDSKYGYIGMMSPSPDEISDLTMASYAKISLEGFKSYDFFLKLDGGFQPEKVVERLNTVTDRPVSIGGAPMLVLALADYVMKSGNRIITMSEESTVTTGGGFKTHQGEMVDRQTYNHIVMEAFGVKEKNIRDVYSMSELNGILYECEHHYKHVPPYFYLSVRNPANLEEEVPFGEEGLPVFIDPLAHSYPGFILADDIVRMRTDISEKCSCGVAGAVLDTSVRRARGAEEKGCGRHVDELKEKLTVEAL